MIASNPSKSSSPTDVPWNTPWPTNELECVSACPVCGSAERKVLHEGLIDNVFFVAPGRWTLYSCSRCSSAYLDPRPNPTSIGKAYDSYFTHATGSVREDFEQLGFFRRLRRRLANSYVNKRYGTRRIPEGRFLSWVAMLFPTHCRVLDAEFRYLPRPAPGMRLLDIGCGNGNFLISAREAGWQASGVEPDPKAAATTTHRGLEVTVGTVDAVTGKLSCFDAITLSHVIEHVHDPRQLLKAVRRLLKPGGIVYVDTPNIRSRGAQFFGQNWRGLEAPRHLVLFNPASLTQLLSASGFERIQVRRRTAVQQGMYLSSLRMAAGQSPFGSEPARLPRLVRLELMLSSVVTERLEFITLTARKANP